MYVLDFDAIADVMWGRARSGITVDATGDIDTAYVRRCSRRVGATTLVFTRDETGPARCRFQRPALQRSWHLSIACRDRIERDAWVGAFFGEHGDQLWAIGPTTRCGRALDVWHWRIFCDADWMPAVFAGERVELRAAGYLAASELMTARLASA